MMRHFSSPLGEAEKKKITQARRRVRWNEAFLSDDGF
jgi:hypothetical protein